MHTSGDSETRSSRPRLEPRRSYSDRNRHPPNDAQGLNLRRNSTRQSERLTGNVSSSMSLRRKLIAVSRFTQLPILKIVLIFRQAKSVTSPRLQGRRFSIRREPMSQLVYDR